MKKTIASAVGLGALIFSSPVFSSQVKMSAPVLFLASGYTGYDQMGTGVGPLNLPTPPKIIYGERQRYWAFEHQMSRDDIAQLLNISVSAKANWSSFSADLGSTFIRNIKDTDYSANYSFSDEYSVDEQLNIDGLAGIGALSSAARILYNDPPPTFTGSYGDEFIAGLSEGGALLIDVQLKFNSHEDKQKFTANLDTKIGSFGSMTGALEQTEEQLHTQGAIEISGYQLGGDISQLPRAFVGGAEKGPGYYVLDCSLQNLTACAGMIQNIMAYDYNSTNPSDPNSFSGQIRQATSGTQPEAQQLAPVGQPDFNTYVNLGLRAPAPKPEGLDDARAQISTLYDGLTTDRTLLTHLQSSAVEPLMDDKVLLSLSDSVNSALDEFNPITNNPMLCYSHGQESQCMDIAKKIAVAVNNDLPPTSQQALSNLHAAYTVSCSESDPYNWDNIYTGTHYIVYPTAPGFAMSGQFNMSPDGKTLSYAGTVTSGTSNVSVRGNLTLNADGFYQGPVVDPTGQTGICGRSDTYIRPITNPA